MELFAPSLIFLMGNGDPQPHGISKPLLDLLLLFQFHFRTQQSDFSPPQVRPIEQTTNKPQNQQNKQPTFSCEVCNYSSKTKSSLKVHLQSQRHLKKVTKRVGTQFLAQTRDFSLEDYRCGVCSYTTTSR